MNETVITPRVEDVVSVGTRISWSAILAGAFLALGIYFLLATLGAAFGLSASERMSPTALKTAVIIWTFATTIVALFVGGMVASLFTVGENKVEAVMTGVIMWALLFALLLALSAAGVRAGFNAMVATGRIDPNSSDQDWETGARVAGVPADQIDDWRHKYVGSDDEAAKVKRDRKELLDAAARISWYAFGGTWLSMLAAAGGALAGAGPTFRIVAVRRNHLLTPSISSHSRI